MRSAAFRACGLMALAIWLAGCAEGCESAMCVLIYYIWHSSRGALNPCRC